MEYAGIETVKWQLLREGSVTATNMKKHAHNGPAHCTHPQHPVPAGSVAGRAWGVTPD